MTPRKSGRRLRIMLREDGSLWPTSVKPLSQLLGRDFKNVATSTGRRGDEECERARLKAAWSDGHLEIHHPQARSGPL
jgi:hypothetical protein